MGISIAYNAIFLYLKQYFSKKVKDYLLTNATVYTIVTVITVSKLITERGGVK